MQREKQAVLAVTSQAASAPSFRVRVSQPAPALLRHGVVVDEASLLTESEASQVGHAGWRSRAAVVVAARRRLAHRLSRDGANTIIVQRSVDVLPSLHLERLAARDRRMILDIDDAVWIAGSLSGGHPLARLKRARRKLRWLAVHADAVVVGNDYLANYIGEHATNVRVIPSLVDTDRFSPRKHEDKEAITLGWIGSPTTARYLERIRGALRAFAATAAPRKVEFLVVGGPFPPEPDIQVECVPWTPEAEQLALAKMDVGLMPLPDTPWTRGKCAYKAVQYMAAGVPVVADPVGVSATVIGPGEAGLLPATESEWVSALVELAQAAGLRSELGAAGRTRVARDFSYDRWIPELAGILRGA